MPGDALQSGPFTFRSPGRHAVAATLAVLGSVVFHVLIVRVLPPLPVGKPPDLRVADRLRSVELHDVRRNVAHLVERPEVFQPENPEAFLDLGLEAESFEAALDAVVPRMPDLDAGSLVGEEEGLIGPEPPAPRAEWEPRQDILAVEKERFAEEVSVLPRKVISVVDRQPRAPDILLPAVPSADEALGRIGSLAGGERDGPRQEGVRTFARLGPGGGAAQPDAVEDLETEAFALLDETPDEVTAVEAIEQLLALELQTYLPEDESDAVYFKLNIQRKGPAALPVVPKDVLLIQDCSESMTQRKLNQCKVGLHAWLDALNPEDRFDILAFRDDATRCFNTWTNLTPATRARANWFIKNMVARGRTDVYASLREVMAVQKSPGRPVVAVLVTDGRPTMGLVDSSDIIERFSEESAGKVSMFAFGGGRRVNRYLLDLLSYKNRGDSLVVKERSDIPGGLSDWAKQLERPVLTDLAYHFAGLDETEIYPKILTHLYLDRPLEIYGRTGREQGKVAFQIVGVSGSLRHDMVFSLPWQDAVAGGEDLRNGWAWQKAYHLIGEHIRTGKPAVMKELEDIAQTYGLAVPYGDYPVR